MDVQETSTKKFILNYGLLLGIVSVILGVIMYVTNAYQEPSWVYTLIGFLILVAIIYMGINAYKKANGLYLTLGEALKIGVGIALIGGIISAIWTIVWMNFLEPDFLSNLMDIQREKLVESQPNMSEQQIDQAMAMGEKFSSPWISAAFSLLGSIFFGFIVALIVGLILKKENPYKQ